jgi:hypothetical protein
MLSARGGGTCYGGLDFAGRVALGGCSVEVVVKCGCTSCGVTLGALTGAAGSCKGTLGLVSYMAREGEWDQSVPKVVARACQYVIGGVQKDLAWCRWHQIM